MKRSSLTIWLALCVALPASAQMYKWVDSDGRVKYSDKPPPSNVKTEKLRVPARAPDVPALPAAKDGESKDASKTGPMTTAEKDQAFRKRQAEAAKEQEKQAQRDKLAADRAENCRRAKAAVANLELGGRQSRVNEKGERVFLDEQEIVQATARARQEADAACK